MGNLLVWGFKLIAEHDTESWALRLKYGLDMGHKAWIKASRLGLGSLRLELDLKEFGPQG